MIIVSYRKGHNSLEKLQPFGKASLVSLGTGPHNTQVQGLDNLIGGVVIDSLDNSNSSGAISLDVVTPIRNHPMAIKIPEWRSAMFREYNTLIATDTWSDISTHMCPSNKLHNSDNIQFFDESLYRSIVGGLQYLTFTRPDISFSVNKICQFMHSPTEKHWAAIKRILRCLKSTSSHGSSLVSWCSRKHRFVSRSTTKAEYRSLAAATSELLWIRQLLKEIDLSSGSLPSLCDNLSVTYLTSYPLADILTKPLLKDRFCDLRGKLNLIPGST
ncbi:hypothetical protein MTR67_003763 [Solanum verrucosum]|uniref:Uncharacterized protein n=1 Tax=Solanum verrucosum TaxID=315347 RepID=A0AAF0PST2_SOLVR|nr:hypothetical protein MTR67_003763 [Solanum verrucosum]